MSEIIDFRTGVKFVALFVEKRQLFVCDRMVCQDE